MPFLNEAYARKAMANFIKYLFTKYRTNQISLELIENLDSVNTYNININILRRTGIATSPLVFYPLLLSFLLYHIFHLEKLPTSKKFSKWIEKQFHCNLTIN